MRLSKISQFNQELPADDDIGWFEIDMDDAMLVEEVQSFGCLFHHQQHLIDRNVGHPAYVMLEG